MFRNPAHAAKFIVVAIIAGATAGCSAATPATSHSATIAPGAVQEHSGRSTCDYALETTALARHGESAVQPPENQSHAMDGPPGVAFEYDAELGEFVDVETGELVDVVRVPTHVFEGTGGIVAGSERQDSSGHYRQVEVAQSAEVISTLDAWPRALPDVHEQWSKAEFYLAQDFAICFLLTWYLDNPAVMERTTQTVEQYAEQAAELVAPELQDAWHKAATDPTETHGTSTNGLQRALAHEGVAHPYGAPSVRYKLIKLRVGEVRLGGDGESLVFVTYIAARYPAVTVPDPDNPGQIKPAAADDLVTLAVRIDNGVPYLVGIEN
mgnify:FL=1